MNEEFLNDVFDDILMVLVYYLNLYVENINFE
jgi:hypothetical protein